MFPSRTAQTTARWRRALSTAVAFATLDAIMLDPVADPAGARPGPAPAGSGAGPAPRRAAGRERAAADAGSSPTHADHPHRHTAALPPRRRRPGVVPAAASVCESPARDARRLSGRRREPHHA